MLGGLLHLGARCWTDHEWIYRSRTRGLWLECRRCGAESPGVELTTPRFRRTQEGVAAAHRLGGVAPARRSAPASATTVPDPPRFDLPRVAPPPPPPSAPAPDREAAWDATVSSSAVAATDAERRWLQAWRALSPDDRVVVERLVAGAVRTWC